MPTYLFDDTPNVATDDDPEEESLERDGESDTPADEEESEEEGY